MASKAQRFVTIKTLRDSITRSPFTANMDHMLPLRDRKTVERLSGGGAWGRGIVPVEERIRLWNIVPGDQIRVVNKWSDPKAILDVVAISKFRNRVFAAPRQLEEDAPVATTGKNFAYEDCQLYLGNRDLVVEKGLPPVSTEVFASKVATSEAKFNPIEKRWEWTRFVAATEPPVPEVGDQDVRVRWPENVEKEVQPPTPDTTEVDAVLEQTYQVPELYLNKGRVTSPPPEEAYLDQLYNPHIESSYGNSQPPFEMYLTLDLGNPHSRAQRQKKWQEAIDRKKRLREVFENRELDNLAGRTRKEALGDAEYKYRALLVREEREAKRTRYVQTGALIKFGRKRERKARKFEQRERRLTELVLEPAAQQVIPAGSQS